MSASTNRLEIEFPEEIQTLEFCPFLQGKDILNVCGQKKFYIQQLKFKENLTGEKGLKEALSVKDLLVVFHGRDINHVTWSPNTTLAHIPRCLEFAVSTLNYKLVYFQLDMADNTKFTEIGQHADTINEIMFSPNEAHLLASVSDDYTCKIWDVNTNQEISKIQLRSPGISVNFHSDCPTQLMIAEEHGKIGFYDIRSHTAVTSLEVPGPLGCAHWAPSEVNLVSATTGHEVFFWNIAMSSIPMDSRMLLMQQAHGIRWERSNSNLYGVVGRMKGGVFCIYHRAHQKIPTSMKEPTLKGLSWHYSAPLCATSSQSKAYLYLASA